jgi:hypothetical protein
VGRGLHLLLYSTFIYLGYEVTVRCIVRYLDDVIICLAYLICRGGCSPGGKWVRMTREGVELIFTCLLARGMQNVILGEEIEEKGVTRRGRGRRGGNVVTT